LIPYTNRIYEFYKCKTKSEHKSKIATLNFRREMSETGKKALARKENRDGSTIIFKIYHQWQIETVLRISPGMSPMES